MVDRLLTPQQENFLAYYTDPKSATFSNALQSALKAGYSQEYSESITAQLPDWLSESLGDSRRLKRAERNLDEVSELEIVNEEGKLDVNILRERTKVDMFLAETIGKTRYSKRSELTGRGGGAIEVNSLTDKSDADLAKIAGIEG